MLSDIGICCRLLRILRIFRIFRVMRELGTQARIGIYHRHQIFPTAYWTILLGQRLHIIASGLIDAVQSVFWVASSELWQKKNGPFECMLYFLPVRIDMLLHLFAFIVFSFIERAGMNSEMKKSSPTSNIDLCQWYFSRLNRLN